MAQKPYSPLMSDKVPRATRSKKLVSLDNTPLLPGGITETSLSVAAQQKRELKENKNDGPWYDWRSASEINGNSMDTSQRQNNNQILPPLSSSGQKAEEAQVSNTGNNIKIQSREKTPKKEFKESSKRKTIKTSPIKSVEKLNSLNNPKKVDFLLPQVSRKLPKQLSRSSTLISKDFSRSKDFSSSRDFSSSKDFSRSKSYSSSNDFSSSRDYSSSIGRKKNRTQSPKSTSGSLRIAEHKQTSLPKISNRHRIEDKSSLSLDPIGDKNRRHIQQKILHNQF
mmetsp:Transcript_22112/g.26070  ORF Transcript_22112/g.26070 Transcript_22112/m.26070 type:complete len:281 (-) Transcript_22112:15-857(-)